MSDVAGVTLHTTVDMHTDKHTQNNTHTQSKRVIHTYRDSDTTVGFKKLLLVHTLMVTRSQKHITTILLLLLPGM